MLEEKKRRKEKKKIEKELKERQTKRLWEAQSIQRKLNEVDVKQFELEERARQVEKDLQDETSMSLMNDIAVAIYYYVVITVTNLVQHLSYRYHRIFCVRMEFWSKRKIQHLCLFFISARRKNQQLYV